MKNDLNPIQREAVLHRDGPLLIFAGAGSGKTRVLTHRIAHLIETGVSPYHILAITFTNKAAKEMQKRVIQLITEGERCWIATFHSACVRILRREIERLGYNSRFSIFDTEDSDRLIKDVLEKLNLDKKDYPVKSISNIISTQKNNMITPDAFARKCIGDPGMTNIAEVYDLYQKKLKSNNALDFDDIIFKTVELFLQEPDVLSLYQNRFKHVMVDEYQDTNTSQYKLIALLAGSTKNLCVVGDDDQSIYAWRGANIKNILSFERDFPNARIIKLEQNYRSTQTILDAANGLVCNNLNRKDKALWTENGQGIKIKIYEAFSDKEEADFVVDLIRDQVAAGAKYSDFAILYRQNAQSRAIEDRLVVTGVPYRLYGGIRFYGRIEIKDILAYLKVINNPADDIALVRIINAPPRGIGKMTIQRLQLYAASMQLPLSYAIKDAANIPKIGKKIIASLEKFSVMMDDFIDFAASHSVSELLQKILNDTEYLENLDNGSFEDINGRMKNVQELCAKAFEFESTRAKPEERSLSAFLEDVALVADIDSYEKEVETVSLLTLHSAKGLEFTQVFMVGFEQGLCPSYYSTLDDSNPDALEEERRLCYVGITRAMQSLYITWALRRFNFKDGKKIRSRPSQFIEEIPKECCENVYKPWSTRNAAAYNNRQYTTKKPSAMYRKEIPAPKGKPVEFAVGDRVRQIKYGSGIVSSINPAGADYEVTVKFDISGEKKIMAHLSRLILER